jgi:hypothetical protein
MVEWKVERKVDLMVVTMVDHLVVEMGQMMADLKVDL